ncbi:MAG: YdgA family protein, partial [Gammaproteobacteria bacterium]|nr:YdgA family protein [Gammaproteobacteria bacterium]
ASAAAPGFVGIQAQRDYESLVAQIESTGYRVEEQSYARGWFRSEARLRVGLPAEAASGAMADFPTLVLRSRVVHGPFLGAERLPLGLARIDTEIGLDDRLLFTASPEPPVQLLFGFGGAGELLLQVPARQTQLLDAQVSADFAGATGRIRFVSGRAEAQGYVAVPGLRVATADGGLTELRGARLDLAIEPGPSGLPIGVWQMALESLKAGGPDAPEALLLQALAMKADSREQAGEVAVTAEYDAGVLVIDGERYGPLAIRLRFAHLPAAALVKLRDAVEDVRRSAVPQEAAAAMALLPLVDDLLASDPLAALDRLQIDTPVGRIEGALEVRAVGLRLADAGRLGTLGLLSKLDGKASFRVPERVVRGAFRQQALARLMAADQAEGKRAAQEAEADRFADQQLATLLAQELAVKEGDRLATVATWRNGLLTVNGKTIPLAPLAPGGSAPPASKRP